MIIVDREPNLFDSRDHVLSTELYYLPRGKNEHAVLWDRKMTHPKAGTLYVEEPRR